MPTQDNSPSRGSIRWFDMKIIFKGMAFNIKDGSTDKKYIYWSTDNPNIFQGVDIMPIEGNTILFINNSGVLTTYPLEEGVHLNDINSSSSSNSLLFDHMSNKSSHVTEELLNIIDNIANKLEKAILRIEELEKVGG